MRVTCVIAVGFVALWCAGRAGVAAGGDLSLVGAAGTATAKGFACS
jgi:hypothetical protein